MAHANARTNLFARRLMVERVAAGWPAAHVAEQLGVSRATVHKWVRRYAEGGDAALADRSSRPVRMPNRTSRKRREAGAGGPSTAQARRGRARRRTRPEPLDGRDGSWPATTCRIWPRSTRSPASGSARHGAASNRYEHPTPGAMIHVDVKKLGRIPAGGGWRLHGREATVCPQAQAVKIGYDYVHTAIDDHTRLAYSEIRPTRRTRPAPRSCTAPWPGSPPTASGCAGCSPTTPWSTGTAPTGAGSAGLAAQTPLHQTRLPLDQRQSRTVQPHPAQRMGLRPSLDQQQPPPPRP